MRRPFIVCHFNRRTVAISARHPRSGSGRPLGAMVSTATDHARFSQMIANRPTLGPTVNVRYWLLADSRRVQLRVAVLGESNPSDREL